MFRLFVFRYFKSFEECSVLEIHFLPLKLFLSEVWKKVQTLKMDSNVNLVNIGIQQSELESSYF
jgi:hypothetical protein